MTPKLYLACALILVGHVVAWYATYSQFIWEWCKDNVIYLPLIFALPTSYLFIFGMKFAVEEMGSAWGPRLVGFGLSYLVFPILTLYILKDYRNSFLPNRGVVSLFQAASTDSFLHAKPLFLRV